MASTKRRKLAKKKSLDSPSRSALETTEPDDEKTGMDCDSDTSIASSIMPSTSAAQKDVIERQRVRAALFRSKNSTPKAASAIQSAPKMQFEPLYHQAMDALFEVNTTDAAQRKELGQVSTLFNKAFTSMRDELVQLRNMLAHQGGSFAEQVKRPTQVRGNQMDSDFPSLPVPTSEFRLVQSRKAKIQNRSKTPVTRDPKPATFAAVITANNPEETADDVKKRILAEVADNIPNVRVRSMRKTKNAVVIETVTQDELDKIIACQKFADAQMSVKEKEKQGDLLYVRAVGTDISDDKFFEQLYSKNFSAVCTEAEFKAKIRFCRRIPAANGNQGGVILEAMDANLMRTLLANRRVFIGFHSFPVREFRQTEGIPRCFRCNAFEHFADKCSKAADLCANCSEPGHFRSACKNAAKCWLCAHHKLQSDHSIFDPSCAEVRRMKQLIANRQAIRHHHV